MEILAGHAEAFMVLRQGEVMMKMRDDSRKVIKIIQGECHVRDDAVVIVL